MEKAPKINRWRHPAIMIFFLGGLLGAGVNLSVTFLLHDLAGWNPVLSFFMGTLSNEIFHHIYYNVVYVNQEIKLKTSAAIHLFLYFWVAAGSGVLLWLLTEGAGFSFGEAVVTGLFILTVSNAVLNRISTFSSSKMAEVEYREMNESFYDDQTDETKVSKFRAWYHRSRYEKLTRFIERHFRKRMKAADFGCGNCWWNVHHLPIFGIDINVKMLKWAKRNDRLTGFKVCSDLSKTGLKSKSLDMVVMTEVLEHILETKAVLGEIKRVLKDDGIFLITVPYDFFMGPFFLLFNLNCLYMGYLRGSLYHRYRCGHIHHFTKKRLKKTLWENGFELGELHVVNGLLLYGAARKRLA